MCIYIYIYIYIVVARGVDASDLAWLRTDGINTNGAAAKVMIVDRLGEKGTPSGR